ncbi:hypothetical protein VTI74DRAFT_7904 [Chaetomium olivicolor]
MTLSSFAASLQQHYPWTMTPLIASAPMARVAKPLLAVSVSRAGGLGFIAAGYTSDNLYQLLEEAANLLSEENVSSSRDIGVLPVGVGFITWSASLETALPAIEKHRPCAAWLFAPPSGLRDLVPWVDQIREVTERKTKIWLQIGCVADAVEAAAMLQPDVLVVQGIDAGGHALGRSASIVSLLPEIRDNLRHIPLLAAGGISDGRGVVAAMVLGAQGCALGTRFLASPEAQISDGYQKEVLRASDGGVSTVRTHIYDRVRDIYGWPDRYDGRGLINRTYVDASNGMDEEENRDLYLQEMEKGGSGYGPEGRMTTYAGTGVGLIREVMPAGEIVKSLVWQATLLLKEQRLSRL